MTWFLEVGYSAGINNTVMEKFFRFDEIVGVDFMGSQINGNTLKGHLMHKSVTIVCGDSSSLRVLNIDERFGPFDLIFY